jgi:type IV secretory pathway protease TraF
MKEKDFVAAVNPSMLHFLAMYRIKRMILPTTKCRHVPLYTAIGDPDVRVVKCNKRNYLRSYPLLVSSLAWEGFLK